MHRRWGFLFLLLLPFSLCAQTPTVVTGTVLDSNGLPYANAKVAAQLVGIPPTQTATILVNGIPVQIGGQQNANADVNGVFSMNLFCNSAGGGCSVISPSGTQWQFTVNTNGAPPPFGTGSQQCTATVTITGASQSISSSFSACPALSNAGAGAPGNFPPTRTTGTVLSYALSNGAYHFTRVDGQFQCGVYFDNALSPGFPLTNDFSCDEMNSDGQRNLTTYHWNGSAYVATSRIDLDQDGHIALAAGNGGGLSTDGNTGNTCIPATISPITFAPQATCWNTSGQESKSVGVSLQGIGGGKIVFRGAATRSTNLTFTFAPINGGSNTTSTACPGAVGNCPGSVGMYQIYELFTVTSPGTGSPTLLVTATYTDDIQPQPSKPCMLTGPSGVTTTAQAVANAGDTVTAVCTLYAAANTNITVNWTFAGTTNSTVSAKTYLFSYGI